MNKQYGRYLAKRARKPREPVLTSAVLALFITLAAVAGEIVYYFLRQETVEYSIMIPKGVITLMFAFVLIYSVGRNFFTAFLISILSPLGFWVYFRLRAQLATGDFWIAASEVGQNALLTQAIITFILFMLYLVFLARPKYLPVRY